MKKNDLVSVFGRVPNKRIASQKGSLVVAASPDGRGGAIYEIARATDAGVVIGNVRGQERLADPEGKSSEVKETTIPYDEAIVISAGGGLYVGEKARDRVHYFQGITL